MPINIPGLTEDDLLSLATRIMRLDGVGWETYSQALLDNMITFMWNDDMIISVAVRGNNTWGLCVYNGENHSLGVEYMAYFGI